MRLTLRNLLNYMDDMLEPNDAAEIRKKVEESQFASDLLQRTRTVMGRMRLGAPKVVGRGMGVDANTVSEYLDHELDADRVQEFEKVCLEADVHLAEVGACHQILALVLGEPATVDPAGRDRMYRLKSLRHDKTHADDPAESSTATADGKTASAEPKKHESREKPEVPEYLRDRRTVPMLSVAATILVATLVGGGLWMALDPNNPISRWIRGGTPVVDNPDIDPTSGDPETPGDGPGTAEPAPDQPRPDVPVDPGPVEPGPVEPGT